MPRFARPHVTGGLFHVISRFHNREFLLDKPGARRRYLVAIEKAAERYDPRILAFCLMSSHVHLVLQLGNDPLGVFMKSVNTGWANWLNKKFKRIGTTLADRPNTVFCDSHTYALELVRYVHNNPVRAKLVTQASSSPWSSHRIYLGEERRPSWLDVDPVLDRFSDNKEEAVAQFDIWVNQGKKEERRPEFSGEMNRKMAKHIRSLITGPVEISYPVLGPDSFIVEAFGQQKQHNDDLAQFRNAPIGAMDVLLSVCQECELEPTAVLGRRRNRHISRARMLTAWIWSDRFFRPQVDIAELLSLRPASVSIMIGKMRKGERAEQERLAIERIISSIRKKIIVQLENKKQEPAKSRDPNMAQHFLLQRLRDVEEKLKEPK